MRQLRVTVDGATLNVRHHEAAGRRAGRGRGESAARHFLLAHGLASNARLWDETASVLADAGYDAWAVDLRGHGESSLTADGFDTSTAARDLAGVCDELELAGVVVAGQSWGGNVAVRFAAEQQARVIGLALVDGGWVDLASEFGSWEACEAALRPPDIDGMPAHDLLGFLRSAHPGWSETAIAATAFNLRERPDSTLERRLPVAQHMMILRDMWEARPMPLFPRITAPTLLIPALPAGDPARTAGARQRVAAAAAAIRSARVREYPDSDHDLHAQHPKELAADLLSLVR